MLGSKKIRGPTKLAKKLTILVMVCAPLTFSSPLKATTTDAQTMTPGDCAEESSTLSGDTLARFDCLPANEQASVLRDRVEDGSLDELPDARIVALVKDMKSAAVIAYVRLIVGGEGSYEYRMRRRERINGQWPALDDHMEVRGQDMPQRIYVRWLSDGAHAGQELIYDETQDPNHFQGHFGGALRLFSGKFRIDGTIARTQSRHSVRDLGLPFIVRTLEHDANSFETEGLSAQPDHVEVLHPAGKRLLAVTWDAPTGPPAHFAPRVTLILDLRRAQLDGVTAEDRDSTLLEQIDFEQIVHRTWTDSTFDPHNPSYNFR